MRKLINGKYVQVAAKSAQEHWGSDLAQALALLNPSVDAHWTKTEGKPDLNAVKELLGRVVTRKQVEAECPGFDRTLAAAAAAVNAGENGNAG